MSEIPLFSSSDELERFLQEKWVDTSLYGKWNAKDVSDLFSELESWEVSLSFDEQSERIMRVVRVLNIDVLHGERVLYEAKQVFKDEQGNETNRERVRDHLKVAVSEKIWPDEDATEWVVRAIKEELGIIPWEEQLWEDIVIKEEELESPSFPQIWTVYQILTTSVELYEEQFEEDWYVEQQEKKNTYFEWWNINDLEVTEMSYEEDKKWPEWTYCIGIRKNLWSGRYRVKWALPTIIKYLIREPRPHWQHVYIYDCKGKMVHNIPFGVNMFKK